MDTVGLMSKNLEALQQHYSTGNASKVFDSTYERDTSTDEYEYDKNYFF